MAVGNLPLIEGASWEATDPAVASQEAALYQFLAQHQITYQRVGHPPVFTCSEARQLTPDLPGNPTKNLFLRDKKGAAHFLLTAGEEESIDLSALAKFLGTSRLSFGSSERLLRYLGVEPGSVTLMALMFPAAVEVQPIFTAHVADSAALQCHPMVNTATLSLSHGAVRQFLAATKHSVLRWDLPLPPLNQLQLAK